MDVGVVLLIGFFAWVAWLMLRSRPGRAMVCSNCGHHGPSELQTKGSIWLEVVLWLFLIVPGLIYSIWRHTTRKQVCAECFSEHLVPPNSPVGRKLLAEHGTKQP
jgi:hypothetical protein